MNSTRPLFCLIFSVIILGIFSCKDSNNDDVAVKYAKRAGIDWWIKGHEEKVTLEFALNDLVKRLNGSIEWFYVNINTYDEISRKLLKSEYPDSEFVGINILNSNNAVLGEIMLAITVNNARWRIVEADFTGFNFTPRTYNIFNFESDLNSIAEIIDEDNDKSYIKELNSKLPANQNNIVKGDICIVNASSLNLRKSPSINGIILETLKNRTSVRVLEVVNDSWLRVKTKNHNGYVYSKYLRKVAKKQ